MIESITIKKVATCDEAGIQINNLKKVNYFFGFNGSGKSTIVKYLHNLSLEESIRSLDYKDCTQNGYNNSEYQILTFDENFTEFNFKQNKLLNGVFSLNEKNETIDTQITDQEEVLKLLKARIKRKERLKKIIEQDQSNKKSGLLDFCWEQRNTFSTFLKIQLAFGGSKSNHFNELKKILKDLPVDIPEIEELTERYNSLYEKEYYEITKTIDSQLYKEIRGIERELNILLSEVIIGNEDVDISALIKKLNSRSWVEAGVGYLKITEDTCPFCQQKTINTDIKKQFDEYFDITYKAKIGALEKLQALYTEKTNVFLFNILEIQNIHNQDNMVSNAYVKIQELFNNNSEVISYKIQHSNEKNSLASLNTIKPTLSVILKSILVNNTTYSEIDGLKSNLLIDLWLFVSEKCKANIETYLEREMKYERILTLANTLIEGYNNKSLISKQAIESLRTQTVNTKDAVDNINYILKNTGFEGFEVAEKDTVNNISQYYLKRNGITNDDPVFISLSEGEKNFISFLYFFQLCIGTDDIENNSTKKKIIVIDDPVSSLDSQSLFVVSTLIHQLLLRKGDNPKSDRKLFKNINISQVFVLTHNLYFYKEVSFEKRPICTDYWHYRITKKIM